MKNIRQCFRAKKSEENTSPFSEYVLQLQRRTADYLNSKARHLTAAQLKVLLVCFCMIAGGLCCYIALKPIIYGNGPPSRTHKTYGERVNPPRNSDKK
ncbi:MAG: hypothetical protein JST19_03690 [Bacteroidetes bacterium]|nr:hypothetical protein [Bacteroidota bacterium]